MRDNLKLNVLDLLLLVLFVAILSLFFLAWFAPKTALDGSATLSVKVLGETDPLESALVMGDTIFLNGTNNPSKVVSVKPIAGGLLVTIGGPAEVREGSKNFNGQDVRIGQRAELHGSIYAVGIVESFDYEK